jgi:hypothetical protein
MLTNSMNKMAPREINFSIECSPLLLNGHLQLQPEITSRSVNKIKEKLNINKKKKDKIHK